MDMRLRSIPLEVGFIPDDWKTITDVEILKQAAVLNVGKMRLIQLMRSDFQINNKILGRRMLAFVKNTVQSKLINMGAGKTTKPSSPV
jgi:hypothetical protein